MEPIQGVSHSDSPLFDPCTSERDPNWVHKVKTLEAQWIQGIQDAFSTPSTLPRIPILQTSTITDPIPPEPVTQIKLTNEVWPQICDSGPDRATIPGKRKASSSPVHLPSHLGMELNESDQIQPAVEKMYAVLIAKPTTKKHKTWQNDGYLSITNDGTTLKLLDEENKVLYTTFNYKFPVEFIPGETVLSLGDKLVQVSQCAVESYPQK